MIDQETLEEIYDASGLIIREDIMKVPADIRPFVFDLIVRSTMAGAEVAYKGGCEKGKE